MAKGTELATAYIGLIPSLDGAQRRIEKELSSVNVKKVGDKLGEQLSDGITDALDDVDVAPVTEQFEGLGDKASGVLAGLSKAAPIAGAAVAAIGGVAIDVGMDFDTAGSRIDAAVGGATESAEALKDVGRTLYEDGWGDSMTQLSDSLITAREILGDISETDMSYLVEGALAIEEVYGSDFSETLRGTSVLMEKFGLDAQEAMDLMVTGTQRGLDYTDELGDNLAEYSGRWADAGVEASEYFSLLEAGADNGAYQLDKVGDFLNEFLTSLSDGRMEESIGAFSESTRQTFEAFKTGGADAKDVLDAVVGELAQMPDGYEKAQIASELWSSLGEDNAISMIESLGNVEDTFDDVAGASDEMTETVSDNLGSKWETALRKWQSILEPVGEVAVDVFGGVADAILKVGEDVEELVTGEKSIDTVADYIDSLGESSASAFEAMGYNVDSLKVQLTAAGVSVEQLDAIGSGHIRSLADTFNGNMDSMVWAIKNYNNVPVENKDGTVTIDDAELIDAQGREIVWNGTTLVYKDTQTTVDDQDLIDAQGRVWEWNGTTLQPKHTSVTVDRRRVSAPTSTTPPASWRRAA